jgi:pimeloyl-ACP methyl ester carboxylesterase
VGDIDITDLLAKVTAKTLVMHVRGDLVCPIEAGRALAVGIPGARFVALQGQNHLFQEKEQASQRFFEEIKLFLAADRRSMQPGRHASAVVTRAKWQQLARSVT